MYTHIDLCAVQCAYIPIYIYTYNTRTYYYILYTIVVCIYLRACRHVYVCDGNTRAVTATHMATLFGLGSVLRSYIYMYKYSCMRVLCENSFFRRVETVGLMYLTQYDNRMGTVCIILQRSATVGGGLFRENGKKLPAATLRVCIYYASRCCNGTIRVYNNNLSIP
jgi:hypothetical protein